MIDTTDIDRWLERYQAAWLSDDPEGTAGRPGPRCSTISGW